MVWTITFNAEGPLTDDQRKEVDWEMLGGGLHVKPEHYLPPTPEAGGAWKTRANLSNDFLIDRQAQGHSRLFGVPGVALQDAAVQESMGPIQDRTRENLCSSDLGVIRARRAWMQGARDLESSGQAPRGVLAPESYFVRAVAAVLQKDESWEEGTAEARKAPTRTAQ